MKKAFIWFMSDTDIEKHFSPKFHGCLEIILEEMSKHCEAEDFVYNYYVEGGIYKNLPDSGAVAHFIECREDIIEITQLIHIKNIVEQCKGNYSDIARVTMQYIWEHNLSHKELNARIKI